MWSKGSKDLNTFDRFIWHKTSKLPEGMSASNCMSSDTEAVKRLIEVFSSNIRKDILKKLNVRNKTISELSRELKTGKSTIHYNILVLLEASMVKKFENGNEFVYYGLTDKAKDLFDPNEKIKLTILITSTVIAFTGGIVSIYRYFESSIMPPMPGNVITPMPQGTTVEIFHYLVVGIILISISTFLIIYIFRILNYRRPVV